MPSIPKGKPNKFGWVVSHPENFNLGRFTDIGYGTYIQSEEGVMLEDYVQIGGGVKIYSVNTVDGTKGRVIIRRNAKIGANSVILPNVEIGENSLIGALSLVNRNIPPNVMACGVPAKVIKHLSKKGVK
ncbi:MAG: acyltransferase [Desulfobacterales bacterium]|nr:acyltransferase [Desulfobacterales bacterium]